jgi:hypothetical protein
MMANRITLTQSGQATSFAMSPVGGLSELLDWEGLVP